MKHLLKNFTSVLLSTLIGLGMAGFPLSSSAVTLKTVTVDKKNFLEFKNLLNETYMANILERANALKNLDNQAAVLKADMALYVVDLKANSETTAFDSMVLANAKALGGALLVNEIKRAGGPSAMLSKASSLIDADIKQFKLNLPPFISLLELVGISDAHAGLRSGACSAFWFVISWGYGTTHAYTSCYQ
ncbi:MAG: hypothetical protein ACXWTS_06380 [Methylococcaceae bacterium]